MTAMTTDPRRNATPGLSQLRQVAASLQGVRHRRHPEARLRDLNDHLRRDIGLLPPHWDAPAHWHFCG